MFSMESTHKFSMERTHKFSMESTHKFSMESTHDLPSKSRALAEPGANRRANAGSVFVDGLKKTTIPQTPLEPGISSLAQYKIINADAIIRIARDGGCWDSFAPGGIKAYIVLQNI